MPKPETRTEQRRNQLLAAFSDTAIAIAKMVEKNYGVQLDDHRHKGFVAEIDAILYPPRIAKLDLDSDSEVAKLEAEDVALMKAEGVNLEEINAKR